MRRRVVVTGIGTISGVGENQACFLAALRSGAHGFRTIDDARLFHLKANRVALVDAAAIEKVAQPPFQQMDRVVHLARIAAKEALAHAGLSAPMGPRAAVLLGTCSGGMVSIERHYEALRRKQMILDAPLLFSKRYYTPARVLAFEAGASGPVMTVVTACAAGAGAIAEAVDFIRLGICDAALAGGADAFAPTTLLGFDALKATCEGICTPFSTNIGLNLGEGAGMLVLESLASATARGAAVLAEILGSGQSNDAYHPTSPDPSSKAQVAALQRALRDAGCSAEDIDYINAHGTGTRANDAVESKTIAKVLGKRAAKVPVSSTKSLIGHCLGAAGALETAAVILTGRAGFCPPTLGFDRPRDGCHLDYVPDLNRPYSGRVALSNSFGFGGNNACLLVDTAPNLDPNADRTTPLAGSAEVRPVITGSGIVHPLGVGMVPLLTTRDTGIGPATRFYPDSGEHAVALVPPVDSRRIDRRLDLKGMGRLATFATLATRLALQTGGVKPKPQVTAEVGLVMGISAGDTEAESSHLTAAFESDFKLDRVESFPFVVQNAAAGQVARALMLKGHSTVISAGWGAGLFALMSGASAIANGHADTLLAVGCDVLTERAYLDGLTVSLYGPDLVPGEGAATVLLEHPDQAASRGALPLAELLGFGAATDVDDPGGAGRHAIYIALESALARAGVDASEINAVGLGQSDHPVHCVEAACATECLRNARQFSLYPRLGFADAALPLWNLAYLLDIADKGTLIALLSLSLEGAAAAVILRRL